MNRIISLLIYCLIGHNCGFGQSQSFETFINPVIPGDHPDFYTTGSSFNPTR
ncbi:MAG: hypothetical protein ABSB78_10050 [Bacteroidota bacterium]